MKHTNSVIGIVSLIVIATILLKLVGLYNASWWIVFLPLLLPLAVYYFAIFSGIVARIVNGIKTHIKNKKYE